MRAYRSFGETVVPVVPENLEQQRRIEANIAFTLHACLGSDIRLVDDGQAASEGVWAVEYEGVVQPGLEAVLLTDYLSVPHVPALARFGRAVSLPAGGIFGDEEAFLSLPHRLLARTAARMLELALESEEDVCSEGEDG